MREMKKDEERESKSHEERVKIDQQQLTQQQLNGN